jgi:hypothetical protein
MEMILSGSVESAAQDGNDVLTATAKPHRMDVAILPESAPRAIWPYP